MTRKWEKETKTEESETTFKMQNTWIHKQLNNLVHKILHKLDLLVLEDQTTIKLGLKRISHFHQARVPLFMLFELC